jgi:hypothetical protein
MLKKLSQSFLGVLLFSAAFISFSNTVLAQDMPKDQLWLVHEEVAKLDMIPQYEKTSNEWTKMMHEAGLDVTFYAFQRNDGRYYYVGKISNYADVDAVNGKFEKAIGKLDKEKFSAMMEANNASIHSIREYVIRRSADLSYDPKTSTLKEGEAHFAHWTFIHYKLEDQDKVMGVLKEWKEVYEKNNYPYGYGIFFMGLGGDSNEFAVFEEAKSAVDYYKNDSDKTKKMKEEENKLYVKFTPYLISVKEYNGLPRPDLNYIPAKK